MRWAAFGCALVPVVLVGRGVPLAGAAATALGLGAVTAAARALLRQSGRTAAGRPGRPRGRHGRAGRATRRGGR
ncbi:hypothetical protein GUY61_22230 [Streptomyces sp. GC420]|nr:hypothetical protein [Streptomyces sp. GC420]